MIPSLFLAHGAPTLATEQNDYSTFVQNLPSLMKTPRAILLFSAHYESHIQEIGTCTTYSMMYDFYGFPDELYQVQYPAKGNRKIAEEVEKLLTTSKIPSQFNANRGLDHGSWVVLRLLYPDADIPVVAMSINPYLSAQEHYSIGQALMSLRQQDILIIGSGGTVHNLGLLAWKQSNVDKWAVDFEEWLGKTVMNWDLKRLFAYEQLAPFSNQAVPRPEHFAPLLIAMGSAHETKCAKRLFHTFEHGSLCLSAWQFD